MKKLLFVLTIAVAILQTSCAKKEAAGGGAGTVKFTANGTTYSYACSEGALVALGEVNMDATSGGNNPNSFSIQLQGNASGTYIMGASTNGLIVDYEVQSPTQILYEFGHMTLQYTQTGTTASATFSGTLIDVSGADSVVITNGTYTGGYNPL